MKFIILLTFVSSYYTGFSQIRCDCDKYRTGKFEVDNHDGTISYITRTGKIQSERSKGYKGKDKIEWLDECSYRLIPLKVKDKRGAVGTEILTFRIVETHLHYYIVRISGARHLDTAVYVKVYERGYLYYDKK